MTNDSAPWPALAVAGRALIADDRGRVLLLERGPRSRTEVGRWELPGGKLTHGERLRDAVAREVAEETGLTVDVGRPLHVSHSARKPYWVTTVTFATEVGGGEITLSPEHTAYQWADPGELGDLELAEGTRDQIAASRTHETGVPPGESAGSNTDTTKGRL